MDWQVILLTAACGLALLTFAGPGFAFRAAKSVVKYAPYPYLSTVLSSGLWAMYAIDWGLVPLLWLSIIGVLLGTVYVFLFLWCSDPADPRLPYLLGYAAAGGPLFLLAIVFDLFVPRTTAYSILCCAASCAASAAPLYNMPRAFREKKMDCMPSVIIPTFALPNGVAWAYTNIKLARAWKDVNYYLVIASAVAGFCAMVQLAMYAGFRMLLPPPPPAGLEEPLLDNKNDPAEQQPSPVLQQQQQQQQQGAVVDVPAADDAA